MLKLILTYLLLSLSVFAFNQQLFYSDIVYGGVTANAGSVGLGSGTINLPVQIPANSTIKKAYLIAARDSLADDITIVLNGINYSFSDTTIVTNEFVSYLNPSNIYRPKSTIHSLDITTNIDSSVNNYSLTIPPQLNFAIGNYSLFYLYIVFENPLSPKITCNLFLNSQDVASITNYKLNHLSPIENFKPVSMSTSFSHACDTLIDGSYIEVNSSNIGLIGGSDFNSSFNCVGAWGNFSHYNDSLFGLDDDNPDSLMSATDVLADIKSYVNNSDTFVDILFRYQSPLWQNGVLTNPVRTVMLSYSTPCDTFSTSITPTDTICLGDSLQLNATGGSQYSWFGAFGGLSDTSIANPKVSPPQTTTYIVTITNDSGCVKTEQVKIWVNPCVGIEESIDITSVEIYPNPTDDNLTIKSDIHIMQISIYDVYGRQIKGFHKSSTQINVQEFQKGIYFLNIATKNGTVVKKFIKQ